MRIGENVFCIGYLLFALIAGIIFISRTASTGNLFFRICAVMTLLLGGGDAFHLIPRIVINFKGETADKAVQEKRGFSASASCRCEPSHCEANRPWI